MSRVLSEDELLAHARGIADAEIGCKQRPGGAHAAAARVLKACVFQAKVLVGGCSDVVFT